MQKNNNISGYSIYNVEAKKRKKLNPLEEIYPHLPERKYDIIYADPPWDYGGKMQFDKTSIKSENINFEKEIFISSANFKYPTLKLKELKELNVESIANDDCLLFMWTTGPHLGNAIALGESWGFEYKTVAFVWDKMIHNPGRYTLSQTEMCLVFKKKNGRIPSPRGARNIRQLISIKRTAHSEKPKEVIEGITKMFPLQNKIELFARKNHVGWDNWGLEIPDSEIQILSQEEYNNCGNKTL
ncbi:MT-A70 family methyltransferase [Caviibacterium pharyngocola]|uniref:Modification methylase n=1 Tax=Caviibacterium pharyngocola TaxID=28159 RepID=A0A2M8RW24_9PAST|nr:MT-A70 family methyltransferase [Caviibacterium pharyngocola]PJG83089.1 modification methylase [Caviibacterium pharyngocola]